MSQLLTRFFVSVHDFNNCTTAVDYQKLIQYYDRDATLYEVDPPNNPHGFLDPRKPANVDGNQAIVDYLAKYQPALLPRFWPSLQTIIETPYSDGLNVATLEGLATYFDRTTNPNTTPFVIYFHFEYTRADPNSLWFVKIGKRI
jgi:hypothetical protein